MKMLAGTGLISEKNHQWKGDDASYEAKHAWIYRRKGKPKECKKCFESNRKLHWANISGSYLRDENDWTSFCVPCHREFDGHTKFTKEEAKKIRDEYMQGGITQQELANRLGVSRCAVVNAIKGKIKSYA